MTQKAKIANYDRLETKNHILEIATTEMPDQVYRHRVGRDTYTWKAYRLAGCAGGYVIGVFDGFNNRNKQVIVVAPLDDIRQANPSLENGAAYAATAFVNARAIATEGGR